MKKRTSKPFQKKEPVDNPTMNGGEEKRQTPQVGFIIELTLPSMIHPVFSQVVVVQVMR